MVQESGRLYIKLLTKVFSFLSCMFMLIYYLNVLQPVYMTFIQNNDMKHSMRGGED